ncbi:MAG TPA: TerB family tellurite resistance protein [Chromatiales bacterium]|nr:TerB family tellurite resistance protein [Chromatiales bacterium]
MIDALKRFLDQTLKPSAQPARDETGLVQMAAAVLLVEVMHADHRVEARERAAVERALQHCFALSPAAAGNLLDQAEARVRDVTSLHEFTSVLHRNLERQEKVELLEQIWRIVLADEEVDRYEEHLVRQIAELLYVSHSDYIRAKLRARGETG